MWVGPLLYMLVVGMYFVGRYAGHWAENDSAVFTQVIRVFAGEGKLIPTHGEIYANGYVYQVLSTFIVSLTGLDVAALQRLVYPLVASLVVLPAWTLYRELTGSARGAVLATILLFTQPEFLFMILRSSHEKFTRTFMLVCLFLLVRSFRLRGRPWSLAAHVMLFYLTAFALIASNNLLGHSFIFAVTTSLLLGWLLERWNRGLWKETSYILHSFAYVTLICLGFVYIITFYIYPPAQHDFQVLGTIWDRMASLFLDVQTTGGQNTTNAYAQVEISWISLYAYFLVSIANWIILAASFMIWVYQGWRWLWRGQAPDTCGNWLLWLLYAAFAAQGAISALADASGALASNLQHRLFPSFSIFAVALVGVALANWRPRRYGRFIQFGLTAGVFCIAMLSTFKATNEPLLSNMWSFYRPGELDALDWSDRHLEDKQICIDFNERLTTAFLTDKGETVNANTFTWYNNRDSNCEVLVTTITRLRSSRLQRPLPVPPDALQVYDNGDAQFYHPRPRTPFQR